MDNVGGKINGEKKSSRPLKVAALGSEMPASELKTFRYCWPINTEMITMTELITMTAQVVVYPGKIACQKVDGLLMRQQGLMWTLIHLI